MLRWIGEDSKEHDANCQAKNHCEVGDSTGQTVSMGFALMFERVRAHLISVCFGVGIEEALF